MTAPSSASGRVLIVGATGFIGRFITEASIDAGRPTYILVRPGSSSPSKANTTEILQKKGAIVVHGLINDKSLMEGILKEHKIEIVISAVGGEDILDQLTLVEAIKAVGTVKRFLPSEFGHDVDRADPVEPGLSMYKEKRKIRRLIEDHRLPYTYVCCNSVASWPYYDNRHPSEVLPPLDQFQIYGDGTVKAGAVCLLENYVEQALGDLRGHPFRCSVNTMSKAYFVAGTDIGKFTMKMVDDDRALNKSVHFRPPCNSYNMNELAALWETKLGRTLPRVTVTEDDLLSAAAENCIPRSVVASFTHDIFIKGCQVNFSVDGPNDVEVTSLYPEEPFRTLDECFSEFAAKLKKVDLNGEVAAQNPMVEAIAITATCS